MRFQEDGDVGAYERGSGSGSGAAPVFRRVSAPTGAELQALTQQLAERIGRLLEKRGLVERDIETAWLSADGPEGPLDDLMGQSITYRAAVGARTGQKLFTLQTAPARVEAGDTHGDRRGAAQAGGFSLHAGLEVDVDERDKLERLCRYVSRAPVWRWIG